MSLKGEKSSMAARWRRERSFLGGSGLQCSGVATAHGLYRIIRNIDVCPESELLEVKVPIVFLGTWVSRGVGRDVNLVYIYDL